MLDRLLWRLWGWPVGVILLVAGLAVWPTACASPADRYVGPVETTQQRVYRAAGIYGVVGGLACEYVGTPAAVPGASARLGQAADAAYDALMEARAYAAFGSDSIAGLAALSGTLSSLAAQALEVSIDAPDMSAGGLAGYATERALQVAVGYVHLRTSLALMRGDLAAMVAEQRDPTATEWDAVMDTAGAARDCLTKAGGAR
jgi:hypothetical protein